MIDTNTESPDKLYNRLYHILKQAIYYEPDLVAQYSVSVYEKNEQLSEQTRKMIVYLAEKKKCPIDDLKADTRLSNSISELLSQINYQILPKTVSDARQGENSPDTVKAHPSVLSNITVADELYWDDVNYVFDIPVPLLLLDVWWCKEVGFCFDDELSDSCYANRLYRNDKYLQQEPCINSRLFKKYIDQYNAWRSNAVTTARDAYDDRKDVTIFSLDFTKYYYSIDIDFDKVREKIKEKNHDETECRDFSLFLTGIIEQIHLKCTKLIEKYARITHQYIFTEEFGSDSENAQKKILPIGLFSSKILANWYLREFDRKVIELLNPAYYGRYVDDLLIVLSKPKFKHSDISEKISSENVNSIFERYLISTGLFEEVNGDSTGKNKKYSVIADNIPENRVILKNDKLKIFQIDANFSKAALDLMLKNILEAKKAFNYLPPDDLAGTLSESVYQLIFEDKKVNKIRGIERTVVNPTALSVLIAKEAYNLRITNTPEVISDAFLDALLADIKGMDYLEYMRLWEKIFTLFVLCENKKRFQETYADIYSTISRLKYINDTNQAEVNSSTSDVDVPTENKEKQLTCDVLEDLTRYLNYSAGLALALLSDDERQKYISDTSEISEENRDEIIESANAYRTADMFRHHHIAYPLLNYVTVVDEKENPKRYDGNLCGVDLFNPDILRLKQNERYELDNEKMSISPRYIHHHELQLFYAWKMLREEGVLTKLNPTNKIESYLTKAICEYEKHINPKSSVTEEIHDVDISSSVLPTKITVCGQEKRLSKVRVGITNITHLEKNLQNNIRIFNKQDTSLKRWKEIAEILNVAALKRCNLIIFPEISIPARWLSTLTLWSREHQIGLIFGMEHIYVPTPENKEETITGNTAYNITAAVLPYQIKQEYKSCCVSLRIKNHYAHYEIEELKKNGYSIPEGVSSPSNKAAIYHLYSWRGNQFTVYNCFELADIIHRSIFKSELDFLVACTYNHDVEYFYDILDSTVRDLHCYAVHVNCADYGCSRVVQPAKHDRRNLAVVGGGTENSLIVTDLDIGKLAAFQVKGHDSADKSLKPLPPGFDSQKVINRHEINDTKGGMDRERLDKQTTLPEFR